MKKVLFKESQQFRQWWYIILILASIVPGMIMCLYTLYMQTIKGVQVGDSPIWCSTNCYFRCQVYLPVGYYITQECYVPYIFQKKKLQSLNFQA